MGNTWHRGWRGYLWFRRDGKQMLLADGRKGPLLSFHVEEGWEVTQRRRGGEERWDWRKCSNPKTSDGGKKEKKKYFEDLHGDPARNRSLFSHFGTSLPEQTQTFLFLREIPCTAIAPLMTAVSFQQHLTD